MSEDAIVKEIEEKLAARGIKDESEKEEAPKVAEEEKVEEATVAKDATVEEEEVVAENATSEFTEVENQAIELGWKPDGPKSAEEFIRAQPLYDELKKRGKEIKKLNSRLEELTNHVSGLKKAGYKEKLDLLSAEREDAVARSDLDTLNYLDDELYNLKSEMSQVEEEHPEAPPEAMEFIHKYENVFKDYSLEAEEVKNFVAERDVQLASHNLEPDIHIKTLEKDMKAKFPKFFEVKGKEPTVSAVESDSRPVTTKRRAKFTFSDLTHHQKEICKGFERKGIMSTDEYIKQLVEIGELG